MRHDLMVSKSVEVNATPSKVWEALTTPEIIKEYLFGTETVNDWKGNNLTEFTWTQKGYANEERHQHSEEGMEEFLGQTKEIMER